jgi:hypothetical protein
MPSSPNRATALRKQLGGITLSKSTRMIDQGPAKKTQVLKSPKALLDLWIEPPSKE